jgi:lipoprotein-anchoring transpeptidase ErfK/SrfK
MRYGQYIWDERRVPNGPVFIRVDLRAQTISVFRSGHEIGTAVILYGADEKPTPTGEFKLLQRLTDHCSSLYEAPMPYTLRLTGDGISIHGSDVKKGAATHGCIGVPIAFAALLFDAAKAGDTVIIV